MQKIMVVHGLERNIKLIDQLLCNLELTWSQNWFLKL